MIIIIQPLTTLINVLFTFVLFGVCLWLIERFVPMAEPIKIMIRVVLVLALIWWLLRQGGII